LFALKKIDDYTIVIFVLTFYNKVHHKSAVAYRGGGGATRPFVRDGGVEELKETQQWGHAPRSGPEVKNGRSGAEDDVPERLGCRTVKEELSQIAGAALRILLHIVA